jgi:hypothetical protein
MRAKPNCFYDLRCRAAAFAVADRQFDFGDFGLAHCRFASSHALNIAANGSGSASR